MPGDDPANCPAIKINALPRTHACAQVKYLCGYNHWYHPDAPYTCQDNTADGETFTKCTCADDNYKFDKKKEQCYESFPRNDQVCVCARAHWARLCSSARGSARM